MPGLLSRLRNLRRRSAKDALYSVLSLAAPQVLKLSTVFPRHAERVCVCVRARARTRAHGTTHSVKNHINQAGIT